jgi:hypothetical protein
MTENPPNKIAWLDRDAASEAIRRMSEDDLRWLNRLIVERLKLIDQARSTVELARFGVGDRVSFQGRDGQPLQGAIIRLNKKTVSLLTDDSQRWNVSPHLLRPVSG